jgi:glycosyltransferase involved in cell wall biosynthesis
VKVVLDCRSVFPGMGGIGRSTAALARHLPAAMPGDELLLLVGDRAFDQPLADVEHVQVDAPMIDPRFEQVRLPSLLADLGADVYHGTCFAVPIVGAGVARVATVHDVVFKRHPELVAPGLRDYLDRWTHVSCELADAVVTPSHFSRRELQALYRCPPGKLDVVPNAVDAAFLGVRRQPPRGAPFVLYVGSLEPKKNVDVLIDAFDRALRLDPDLPHQLVLVGGRGGADLDLAPLLERATAARGRIHVLGHVSDAALLELYGAADLFCYLSKYEGFGLPPLEAMAAGVPCIVSDRAALPEVVKNDALTIDPDDVDSVAGAIRSLLRDGARAEAYSQRGRSRARQFSWERSARQLANVYRKALRRFSEADAIEDEQPTLRVLRGEDA